MSMKALTPDISVTGQITPHTIAAAHAAGIRTVINNRPDGEEPDQPISAALARAAQEAGVEYHHIPVVPGQYSDAQIAAFTTAMSAGKPVLAFCKSGMRAASLWALSQAGKLPTADIMRQAVACGYDIAPLAPRIEARAAQMRP